MVKFKDFSRLLSVFEYFKGKFNFQGLYKTVLYIQVLYKPAGTLHTHSKISCKTPVPGYCIIIKVIYINVSLGLVDFEKSATISVKTKQSLTTNYGSDESRYQRVMCDPHRKALSQSVYRKF